MSKLLKNFFVDDPPGFQEIVTLLLIVAIPCVIVWMVVRRRK